MWAALEAALAHLANKHDKQALSDLLSGRPEGSEEAVEEARRAANYRKVVMAVKELLK